eukprot:CAMPEP_0194387974 /NCGR_PEP_ID=MMETSP0174-20130528/95557_1 /TAXON_ID=216777 /ORGANISM="Proboscia alata, Strain PI-D3" /LENGTH=531 /DNA_ID=CAMNT_0039178733 /DNA_START=35 /DNA_END=1630 /DNA_ORIENTATION=-
MDNEKKYVDCEEQEERKRLRRERIIQRSSNAFANGCILPSKSHETKNDSQNFESSQQIKESLALLDREKCRAITKVTQTRVQSDFRESSRRIDEESKRAERRGIVEESQSDNSPKRLKTESKWNALLLDNKTPLGLQNDIEKQKCECISLVKEKNSVISLLEDFLRQKDETYVKALSLYSNDIDKIRSLMKNQIKDIQGSYTTELNAIEKSFYNDREEAIGNQRKEICNLLEKSDNLETKRIQLDQDRDNNFQRDIAKLQEEGSEEHKTLKITLETDINKLEHELEEIRAKYHLNTDKLDYNFRILSERDGENIETAKRQKKRILKTKDELNCAIEDHHQCVSKEERKIKHLKEDTTRILRQFDDMQTKFQHFEIADKKKYKAIHKMHEEEIDELVERLQQVRCSIEKRLIGKCEDSTSTSEEHTGFQTPPSLQELATKCLPEAGAKAGQIFNCNINAIDTETRETWVQLESWVVSYNKSLSQRVKGLQKIDKLRGENERLKSQLYEYAGSKINDELIIPPFSGNDICNDW